jgi:hypothetical protein
MRCDECHVFITWGNDSLEINIASEIESANAMSRTVEPGIGMGRAHHHHQLPALPLTATA